MSGRLDESLGWSLIFLDHWDTWSVRVGRQRRRDRVRAASWEYGLPSTVGVALLFVHLEIKAVTPILSGVTVFTGLLFTLLVLIFNTGITLRKDGDALHSAHNVKEVIADLRANVTYAAFCGVLLAILLVVAGAMTPSGDGLAWGWAPPIFWLFIHLLLNLFTILRRFRIAFRDIAG